MTLFSSLIQDMVDDINSRQFLPITEFIADGSPQQARIRAERPKRPMAGISQYPRYDISVQRV